MEINQLVEKGCGVMILQDSLISRGFYDTIRVISLGITHRLLLM